MGNAATTSFESLSDFEAAIRGDYGDTRRVQALFDLKQLEGAVKGLHGEQRRLEVLDMVLSLSVIGDNKLFLGCEQIALFELLLAVVEEEMTKSTKKSTKDSDGAHNTRTRSTNEEELAAITAITTPPPSSSLVILENFEVLICSATGLAKADGMFGLSDPYTVVRWNDAETEVGRTPVIAKTLSPEWTEKNKFSISYPSNSNPSHSTLICEIWDHDFIGKHDFLGGIEVTSRYLKDWLLEASSLATGHIEGGLGGGGGGIGGIGGSNANSNSNCGAASIFDPKFAYRSIDLAQVKHIPIEDQQLVQGSIRIGIKQVFKQQSLSHVDKILDIFNSLSLRSDNASRMGSIGVIETLVAICKHKISFKGLGDAVVDGEGFGGDDGEVLVRAKVKALAVLKNLSVDDDNDQRMRASALGFVELLVNLLRSDDCGYYGRVYALGIFRNISLDSDFKQSMIEDRYGLVDLLVQLSRDESKHSKLFVESFELQVVNARGLARADFEPFGQSDPFVEVKWNEKLIGKTPHVSRNLNPDWKDQYFHFSHPLVTDDVIKEQFQLLFDVWDYDLLGGGDFLGGYVVKGEELLDWLEAAKSDAKYVSKRLNLTTVPHLDIKEQGLVQGDILISIKHLFDESQMFNSSSMKEDKLDARINALHTLWNLSGDIFHRAVEHSHPSPFHSPVKVKGGGGVWSGGGYSISEGGAPPPAPPPPIASIASPLMKLKRSVGQIPRQITNDLVQKLGSEKLGLVEMCLQIVKTDKTEARNIALNILKFTSRNNLVVSRLASESLKLVEQLITVLKKERSVDTRLAALSILLNLTVRSAGRARLTSEKVVLTDLLMGILSEEKPTSDLFKMVLAIFKNLSINEDQQIKMGLGIGVSSVQDSIVSLCISLLSIEVTSSSSSSSSLGKTISNPSVLMDALKLLNNVSKHVANELRLAHPSLGLVDMLIALAKNHEGDFRVYSVSILWNLVTNAQNQVQMASENVGMLEVLLPIIQNDKSAARFKALGTIRVLSSNKNNLTRLGSSDLGLIEVLVSVIKDSMISSRENNDFDDFASIASSVGNSLSKNHVDSHSNNSDVFCFSILQNLSSINENKVRMGTEKIALIELLTAYISLNRHPSDCLLRALVVLWNLSLNIDNKIRMANSNLGLIERVVHIYENGRHAKGSIVDDTAMSLLWNISGSDSRLLLMQLHQKHLYPNKNANNTNSNNDREPRGELDVIEDNKKAEKPFDFLQLLSEYVSGDNKEQRKVALKTLVHICTFGATDLKEEAGAEAAGILPALKVALEASGDDIDSRAYALDIVSRLSNVSENKVRIADVNIGLLGAMLSVLVNNSNMETRVKILNLLSVLLSSSDVQLEISVHRTYCISILKSLVAVIKGSVAQTSGAVDHFDLRRKALHIIFLLTSQVSIQGHFLTESWFIDSLIDLCASNNPTRKRGWQWFAAREKMLKVVAHAKLTHLDSSEKMKPGDLALFIIQMLDKTPYDSINFEKVDAAAAVEDAFFAGNGDGKDGLDEVVTQLSPRAEAGNRMYEESLLMLFQLLTHANGGARVVNEEHFSARSARLGLKAVGMLEYIAGRVRHFYSPPSLSILEEDDDGNNTSSNVDIKGVVKDLIGPLNVMSHMSTNLQNQDVIGKNLSLITLLVSLLSNCRRDKGQPVSSYREILSLRSLILSIFVNMSNMESNHKNLGNHHLGLIEVLVDIIRDAMEASDYQTSESRYQCLCIIFYLSQSYEIRTRMSLGTLGLLDLLRLITIEQKSAARDKAVDALKNLTEDDLTGTGTAHDDGFVDPDLIDSLVDTLKQARTTAAVKMKALGSLVDLSRMQGTKSILMSENMKFLELALDLSRAEHGFKLKCLAILRNISGPPIVSTPTTNSNKNRLGSEKLGLIKILLETMQDHPEACTLICLQIISNASENNDLDISMGFLNSNLLYLADDKLKLANVLVKIAVRDRHTSDEGIESLKILHNLATCEGNQLRLGGEKMGFLELLISIVKEAGGDGYQSQTSDSQVKALYTLSILSQNQSNQVRLASDGLGFLEIIIPIIRDMSAISSSSSNYEGHIALESDQSTVITANGTIASANESMSIYNSSIDSAIATVGTVPISVVDKSIERSYVLNILLKLSSNKTVGKRLNSDSLNIFELLLHLSSSEVGNTRKILLEILQNLIILKETRHVIDSKGDYLIDLLIENLLIVLKEEKDNPIVVLKCIFIFHQLCANPTYKSKFGANGLGLIELLLQIAQEQTDTSGGTNSARKQALALLAMLFQADETKLRVILDKKYRFVEKLLSIAKEMNQTNETRLTILDIFFEASCHVDLKVKLAIKVLGMIDFILDVLNNFDAYGYDSFLQSLRIMWNLSGNVDNKVTMGDSRISPVVDVMKSVISSALYDVNGERVSEECNRIALGVLQNLSTEEENKVALGDPVLDIMSLLVATVKANRGETRVKAIGILQNLSGSAFNKMAMGAVEVGIPALLCLILNEGLSDTSACFKALGALHNLSLNQVNEVRLAHPDLGLVERLVSIARDETGDFRVKSLGILWNLAANSENQVRMASESMGLVELLMVIINEDASSEARVKALSVLRNLSIHAENKERMGSLSLGLVELLLSIVREDVGDVECVEDSLCIIQNLSVCHTNRLLFCKDVEYSDLLPLLVKTCDDSSVSGADIAIMNIMWNLSAIDENKVYLGSTETGLIEVLAKFIWNKRDLQLADKALNVLNNLLLMDNVDAIYGEAFIANISRFGSNELRLVEGLFELLTMNRGSYFEDAKYIGQKFIALNATKAICCLSVNEDNQLRICARKYLDILLSFVKSDFSESRMYVLSTLVNLSQHPINQELMGGVDSIAIKVLISIANENSTHGVAMALSAIGNLSLNQANAVQMGFPTCGLVSTLRSIISAKKTEELRFKALCAMVNLTANDENQAYIGHENSFQASGLVELLMEIIQLKECPLTYLKALCVLKNLSVDPNKKQRLASLHVGAIELILSTAYDNENSESRDLCFSFLSNLYTLPFNRPRFVALGLHFLDLLCHLEEQYIAEYKKEVSDHQSNDAKQHLRKCILLTHLYLADFHEAIAFLPSPPDEAVDFIANDGDRDNDDADGKTHINANLTEESHTAALYVPPAKVKVEDLENIAKGIPTPDQWITALTTPPLTEEGEVRRLAILAAKAKAEIAARDKIEADKKAKPRFPTNNFLDTLRTIVAKDHGTPCGIYRLRALLTILAISNNNEFRIVLGDETFGFVSLVRADVLEREWPMLTESSQVAMQILWNISGNKTSAAGKSVVLDKALIANIVYLGRELVEVMMRIIDANTVFATSSDTADTTELANSFSSDKLAYLDGVVGFQYDIFSKAKMKSLALRILWFLSRNETNEVLFGRKELGVVEMTMKVIAVDRTKDDSQVCMKILHNLATCEENQLRLGGEKMGLVELLISIVKEDTSNARVKALGALSVISHYPINQKRMGHKELGLIELLITIVQEDKSLSRITSLNILWNLSRNEANVDRLMLNYDPDATAAVDDIDDTDSMSIKNNIEVREWVNETGGCEYRCDYLQLLTSLLREYDTKLHFQVLVALFNLSKEGNLGRMGSKELFLVETLMDVMKFDKKSENCILVLKIFESLASFPDHVMRLIDADLGLMELLLEVTISDMSGFKIGVVKSDNPEISFLSLKVVEALAQNPIIQLRLTLEGLGLLKLYKKVVKEDRSESCITVLRTLNTLAKNGAVNKIRMTSGDLRLIESCIDALKDNNNGVKYMVLELLTTLSDPDGKNSIAHRLLDPEVGLLQAMVTVLFDCSLNDIRSAGLKLFINLTNLMLPPHKRPVLSMPLFYDLIDMLVKLAKIDSQMTRLDVMYIFSQLSRLPNPYKVALGDEVSGIFELIVWLLKTVEDNSQTRPPLANLGDNSSETLMSFTSGLASNGTGMASISQLKLSCLKILKSLSSLDENRVRMLSIDMIDYDLSHSAELSIERIDEGPPSYPPVAAVVVGSFSLAASAAAAKTTKLHVVAKGVQKKKDDDRLLTVLRNIIQEDFSSEHSLLAIGVLQNLSVSPYNKVRMGSPLIGIPELLVAVIRRHTLNSEKHDSYMKAILTLHNLSLNQVNEVRLAHPDLGLVERLVSIARDETGDFRVKSLGILWNLAANSENQVRMASESMGLVELLMVIINEDASSEARVKALSVLRNLSIHAENKERMGSLSLGLVELLTSIIKVNGDGFSINAYDVSALQQNSFMILQNISVSAENKVRLGAEKLKLIEFLISLLTSKPSLAHISDLQLRSISLLYSLSSNPGNRVALLAAYSGKFKLLSFLTDLSKQCTLLTASSGVIHSHGMVVNSFVKALQDMLTQPTDGVVHVLVDTAAAALLVSGSGPDAADVEEKDH